MKAFSGREDPAKSLQFTPNGVTIDSVRCWFQDDAVPSLPFVEARESKSEGYIGSLLYGAMMHMRHFPSGTSDKENLISLSMLHSVAKTFRVPAALLVGYKLEDEITDGASINELRDAEAHSATLIALRARISSRMTKATVRSPLHDTRIILQSVASSDWKGLQNLRDLTCFGIDSVFVDTARFLRCLTPAYAVDDFLAYGISINEPDTKMLSDSARSLLICSYPLPFFGSLTLLHGTIDYRRRHQITEWSTRDESLIHHFCRPAHPVESQMVEELDHLLACCADHHGEKLLEMPLLAQAVICDHQEMLRLLLKYRIVPLRYFPRCEYGVLGAFSKTVVRWAPLKAAIFRMCNPSFIEQLCNAIVDDKDMRYDKKSLVELIGYARQQGLWNLGWFRLLTIEMETNMRDMQVNCYYRWLTDYSNTSKRLHIFLEDALGARGLECERDFDHTEAYVWPTAVIPILELFIERNLEDQNGGEVVYAVMDYGMEGEA